jgi:acyl-CoA thioester hydrolase
MFTYEVKGIRVRYADTDQMGYMYYGNYARLYEIARVEAFRHIDFSYRDMEEAGTMMPVLENHSYYHQPARYDDELSVKVTVAELPMVRAVFRYEVRNQDDILLNTGETTLVFLNRTTNRPTRIPKTLLEKLKPFFV